MKKLIHSDSFIWLFFSCFGTFFVLLGLVLSLLLSYPFWKEKTSAVVLDPGQIQQEHCSTQVEYETQEGTFLQTRISACGSDWYPGKRITIYYDKNDPQDVQFAMPWWFGGIFMLVGGVFAAIGICGLAFGNKKKQQDQYLKARGQKVTVQYVASSLNPNLTVNGRHPWQIRCAWYNPATGQTGYYTSENIWFEPEPIIEMYGIREFDMYIDPKHPDHAYIDLDRLKNRVREEDR